MAFWNSPAIQARLHALAGALAPQALALNTSATYLGVAAGAGLGGLFLEAASVGALTLVAAGFGVLTMALLSWADRFGSSTGGRKGTRTPDLSRVKRTL